MDELPYNAGSQFSHLAAALNALERSRADQRMIGSYKCPCTECKGGGRPILRSTIETHLRRYGRDPTLTHSMLPEDSDHNLFNYGEFYDPQPQTEENSNAPPADEFDEGMDFQRLTAEWFQRIDDRREGFAMSSEEGHGGENQHEHVSADSADPDMEEWLQRSQVPLYPGSKISTLACVLVLMNLAHLHNVSNSFMDELLSFLTLDVLPKPNGLPNNRHGAWSYIDRLGLSFDTIHTCRNGCVLFWKDRAHLLECPKCLASRYMPGSCYVPVKVLRHFPLIPRLLRMYRCRDIASLMKWHEKNPSTDGKIRSVLDSPAWMKVKEIDATFFENSRNVKLGLALDGMNPFADMSTRHSTWPVFLLNYNLPGWMVTKRFFVMLSLIIPGKESVKSANIDVYLEPLLDELLVLWDGVPAIDMSESPQPSRFTLRAMLLWTIHDYPGYGLISGCATKGYQGCPVCGPNVDSRFSKSLKKNVFQGHRRYLPDGHPFRFMTQAFNGKQEHRQKPRRVSGIEHKKRGEARDRWIAAGGVPRSESDPVRVNGVKRNSILFKLPYWDKLLIRHIVDTMHCEKNFAENLLKTVFGMKDGPAVREDMKEADCKPALHIRRAPAPQTGFHVPKAPYVLSEESKRKFIDRLSNMKAPTGYMSNMKSRIYPDGTLHGLKSHDYHVLMQQIFPICISGLLPQRVEKAIMHLSSIFRKLCSKTVDPENFDVLTEEVAFALCLVEREFPPSFFDPMTHLVVHLVEELFLCGPVHNRWMYPLERYMKYMKAYVRNKARPEGCMATGNAMEVGLGLCTEYILECESTRQRVWDAEEEPGDSGELTSSTYSTRNLSVDERMWAHSCVLNNSICLASLQETHRQLTSDIQRRRHAYRQSVHPRQRRRLEYPVELELISDFPQWLERSVQAGQLEFEDDVIDLSMPPNVKARSFKSMKAYAMHLRVSSAEINLVTADSGVTVTCDTIQQSSRSDKNPISGLVTYYGTIVEILELDYGRLKPIVLLCDWVEPIRRGPTACLKEDKYGYTSVKLSRLMKKLPNSFVFPLQVSQIFFCHGLPEEGWSTVLHADSRSTRVSVDVLGNCSLSSFDVDGSSFMQAVWEEEDMDTDVNDDFAGMEGETITEHDFVHAHVLVDNEAQQAEEDGSEDDTLFEFTTEEDGVENVLHDGGEE